MTVVWKRPLKVVVPIEIFLKSQLSPVFVDKNNVIIGEFAHHECTWLLYVEALWSFETLPSMINIVLYTIDYSHILVYPCQSRVSSGNSHSKSEPVHRLGMNPHKTRDPYQDQVFLSQTGKFWKPPSIHPSKWLRLSRYTSYFQLLPLQFVIGKLSEISICNNITTTSGNLGGLTNPKPQWPVD